MKIRTATLSIRLTPKEKEALKKLAIEKDTTITRMIVELLDEERE